MRRRDERAENHHATQPHDERSQRDVPDHGHPVIISLAAWIPAAIDWLTELALGSLRAWRANRPGSALSPAAPIRRHRP